MAKLGVREKYLKKLQTTVISATRVKVINTGTRRKTWIAFCAVSIIEAFAIGDELPKQEGGGYV